MPRFCASCRASRKLPSDEYGPGMATPSTFSGPTAAAAMADRKSTRLNSNHGYISYAVFCLKKKKNMISRSVGAAYKTESRLINRRQTDRGATRLLRTGRQTPRRTLLGGAENRHSAGSSVVG